MGLVFLGGFNWALIGLLDFDLIKAIFGGLNLGSRIVFILFALAAFYLSAESVQLGHKDYTPDL
jgi:hypothetical protein